MTEPNTGTAKNVPLARARRMPQIPADKNLRQKSPWLVAELLQLMAEFLTGSLCDAWFLTCARTCCVTTPAH